MTNINLLPWRDELRRERQRQFISVLGLVAILAVAVMLFVYLFYSNQLESQRVRNQLLQTEIRMLDSKIREISSLEKEREDLISRMNIIQNLQKSRPQVVHIFDAIVKAVPEGINLLTIERKQESLIFRGIAESSTRVSKFMRSIDASKWIKAGELEKMSPDKDSGSNRKLFVLTSKTKFSLNDEEMK